MKPNELEQLKELFYTAIERPLEQRPKFLAEACGGNEHLRAEAARLLAEHDCAGGFLESPFSSVMSIRYLAHSKRTLETNRMIAGRYRVVNLLGEGGMGVVYKAEDTRLPRFVALKSIGIAVAGNPDSLDQLRREAQTASSLNHPNISTIYDVVESEGQTFIVMEFLDGQTLKELIRDSLKRQEVGPERNTAPLPLDKVMRMAMQIIEGLETAHEKGIVHRDIKPANIFVTRSGHVKILDFGIAKTTRVVGDAVGPPEPQSNPKFEASLTTTGVVAGTIGYMSPEQLSAKPLDARTDLFSFGAVLYEMTTGCMPFTGDSTKAILDSILNQGVVPAVELNPNTPTKLGEMIDKCLRKDRELRYQSASDVRMDLQQLRSELESVNLVASQSAPNGRKSPAAEGDNNGLAKDWSADSPGLGSQAKFPRRLKGIIVLIAAIVIAVSAASYFSFRLLGMPDQPRIARLDSSSLIIMNAGGKELWRKVFPEGFGPDWYYAQWQPRRIWFGDLEGKGHTSVLFSYSSSGPLSHSSTLICYSDRGKEKWRWTPGRELPEVAGSPATFITHTVRVLKATDKRPPRIVVLSQHSPWWPSQIALLDSSGRTVSEYWHSGGLGSMVLADLDGDGREEIVATGVSEYDHQATLVVLDPDRVFGASTEVRPEFQIHGMGVAQERLRLLFPRSDLNRALFQYNAATDPTFEHGVLRLTVFECITPYPGGCGIYYEFDRNFRLIAAYAGSDDFRSAHNRFFQTGKNAHPLSTQEQATFQKVRCLVGCKSEFVPVGNLVP